MKVDRALQIQLAVTGRELSDLTGPTLIRGRRRELLIESVWCRRDVRSAATPPAASVCPHEAVVTHQPGDPLAAMETTCTT